MATRRSAGPGRIYVAPYGTHGLSTLSMGARFRLIRIIGADGEKTVHGTNLQGGA